MGQKMKAYTEMSKKKFELDEKLIEVEQTKDAYSEALVDEAISNILNILNEEGSVSKRDLKLFLGSLSTTIKNIYSR